MSTFIPSRYYSNIVGLQLNRHTFDVLGNGIEHVAQFGSTTSQMDMRFFVDADEQTAYGIQVANEDGAATFKIGYWDENTNAYVPQLSIDRFAGVSLDASIQFSEDIYFPGNVGVGTTRPYSRVTLSQYNMDINGSFYTTGTVYTSNLVVYGSSVVLDTITSNTERMVITNIGTGPALLVSQFGSGTSYPVAEFRDGDSSNVAMIIADGGNVGIGTRYPTQSLDIVGSAVVTENIGIGTTTPRNELDVFGNASFTNYVGIGISIPRNELDIIGIASITNNVGIGTTIPLGALHVENGPSYLAPNVGIGTTLPQQELHVDGSAYITSTVGIGTSQPRGTLDVVGPNALFSTNIGIGTTTPRNALDVIGDIISTTNVGIGTSTPRKALDVIGDIISTTNIGVGTTTPREALDVMGDAIISRNLGIGTTTPRQVLDISGGDAIFSQNIGIGTTQANAPLYVEYGPILLHSGNLGIGTLQPTNPLHVADSARIANKRFSYRLPLSTASQTIQFFNYQYTSFAPFYIRVYGQVYSGFNTMYIDVHFGGRYGYGVRTQHANLYGNLKNVLGNDVTSAFQVKFYKKTIADEYQGFLVLNEGTSENIGIDLNFDVHYGEDTFIWSASTPPVDFSLFWNATQDAQMIEYDTAHYQRDPVGVGTTTPNAWVNILGLSSSTLTLVEGKTQNANADYMHLISPADTSVLKIDYTTNVGIGTSIPLAKLDVYGKTHIEGYVGIGTLQPRKTVDIVGDLIATTNIGIGTTTPRETLDVSNRLITGGEVGIGTTTPRKFLDVIGDIITTTNVGIGTTTPRNALDVSGNANITHNIGIGTTTPRLALDVIGKAIVTQNIGIGTSTPNQMLHVEGFAYIGGNLGVGTVQPLSKLSVGDGANDVTSTIMLNSGDTVTNTDKIYFTYIKNGSRIGHQAGWNLNLFAGQSNTPASSTNGNFHFYTGANEYNERFTILNNGNIGISTATPRKALDVIGDIITTTNIGIGTTTPRYALDVMGKTIISQTVAIGSNLDPRKSLDVIGDIITTTNIGIGTTTPRKALDVIGDVIATTNIGIGTTTPRKTLDVMGDVYVHTNIGIGTISPTQALDVQGTGILRNNLVVGQTSLVGYQSVTASGDDVIIAGQLAVAGSEGSAIYKLGVGYAPPSQGEGTLIISANTGIGTSQPRSKLDVEGSVLLLGNVGIGTTIAPNIPLAIYNNRAILIPKGTTNDRPNDVQLGYIRYNTTTEQFEGFGAGNQWGSLGGVKDVNGDTYIVAEYSPGNNDDNLRFLNSNVETMRIQFDGNVGIGTNLPRAKFHILHTGAGNIVCIEDEATPSMTPFIINENGNVGIGTTQAPHPLSVNGIVQITGTIESVDSGHISVNPTVTNNTGNTSFRIFRDVQTTGIRTLDIYKGDGSSVIDTRLGADGTASYISVGSVGIGTKTPLKRLHLQNGDFITTIGNIGIGTTTPVASFHTEGDSILRGNVGIGTNAPTLKTEIYTTTSGPSLTLRATGQTSHTGIRFNIADITNPSTNYNKSAILFDGSDQNSWARGNLHLCVNNSASDTNVALSDSRVVIRADGNVGIGTTIARKKLEVWGDAVVSTNIGIGTTRPRQALDISSGNAYIFGNIGLGTTQPARHVHIYGDTPTIFMDSDPFYVNLGARIQVPDASYLQIGGDSTFKSHVLITGETYGAGGTVDIRYNTAVTFDRVNGFNTRQEKMRINMDGNVGIGTSTPRKILDVIGDAIVSMNIGIGTTQPRKAFDVEGDGIFTTNIGIGTTTPRKALDVKGDGIFTNNVGIGTTTPRQALDVGSGNLIVTDGFVGIGTITPKASLDIIGNTLFSGNLGVGTTNAVGRIHSVGNVNIQTGSVQLMDTNPGTMIEKAYSAGDRYGLGQYAGGILRNYVSDTTSTSSYRIARQNIDGTFDDLVTVTHDGNIGVGDAYISAKEKLDIQGTLRVTDGLTMPKDTIETISLPQGLVRRKFTHNRNDYPNTTDDMRNYFLSNMTYINSEVVSTINQTANSGDYYAYEFTGYIYASNEGLYTFNIDSDNASDAFVDGKLVADYYGLHTALGEGNQRTIYLSPGLHSLVVRYQEISLADSVSFSWKIPSTGYFVPVPSTAFYYKPEDLLYTVQNQLVYTQGNLGIGTLAPRTKLDVQGNMHIQTALGIGTTSIRQTVDVIGSGIFSGNLGIGTTHPYYPLTVYGNTAIEGNVGIGFTNPSVALHVRGDAIFTPQSTPALDYKSTYLTYNASDLYGTILSKSLTYNNQANTYTYHTDGTHRGFSAIELQWRNLAFYTVGEEGLSDVTGLTNLESFRRVTITSNGQVGIGTSTPSSGTLFDVHGSVAISKTGNLGFGARYGQHVNLYQNTYAIGVQNTATYMRSAGDYHMFIGGTHSDTRADPGTNGLVAMSIYQDGNVGIGTTTPQNKFHVVGDIVTNTRSGIGTLAPRKALDVIGDIISTNNIGIGTTTPRHTLDVNGTATISTTLGIGIINARNSLDVIGDIIGSTNLGIGTSTPRHALDIMGTGIVSTGLGIGTTTPRKALDVEIGDAIFAKNVGIGTTTPKTALDIIGVALVSGNVGIGTTTPLAMLDVRGTTRHLDQVDVKATSIIFAQDAQTYTYGRHEAERVDFGWETTGGAHIQTYSKSHATQPGEIEVMYGGSNTYGKISFRYYNGTGWDNYMNLNGKGNLAIGNINGAEKLHVDGRIRSTFLDASKAIVSDADKNIITSDTTATQISYLSTTTCNVQDQLDSKLPLAGGTITGDLIANSNVYVHGTMFTSNLKVLGATTVLDTTTCNTEQFYIENAGSGTALTVVQSGHTNVAEFIDKDIGISLLIQDGGNVGIGTYFAQQQLHVVGTTTITNSLGIGIITPHTNAALDVTGGNSIFSANVGIGTTIPRGTLEVYGPTTILAGNLGIGTTTTNVLFEMHGTNSMLIPKGTTLERPTPGIQGYMRYNTDTYQFEGFGAGDVWGSLGGVKSTDQLTYITAEQTAGANDSNIRFYTGAQLQMILNPQGNLGIGTTIPLAKAHIYVGSGAGDILRIDDEEFESTPFIINDEGNVGIGTMTPRTKLDVLGSIIASSRIGIGTTTTPISEMYVHGQAIVTANIGIGTTLIAPNMSLHVQGDAYTFGNIGVGTATPLTRLVVGEGSHDVSSAIMMNTKGDSITNLDKLYLTPSITGSRIGHQAGWNVNFYAGESNQLASTTNGNFHFYTGDLANYNERLTILNNGNIGVGTTSPKTYLDVNGNAHIATNLGIGTTTPRNALDVLGKIIASTSIGIGTTTPRAGLDVQDELAIISGNLGIGTTSTSVKFEIHSSDSMLIPKGAQSDRPQVPIKGYIRYNTDIDQFEGYGAGNNWGTLGGVKSTDQLTYISSELYPGANDCNIRFFTANQQQMILNPYGNLGIGTTDPIDLFHVEGKNSLFLNNNVGIGTIIPRERLDVNTNMAVTASNLDEGYLRILSTDGKNYLQSGLSNLSASSAPLLITDMYNVNEWMRVETSGNLGIGTSIPLSKLHVQGNAMFSEANIGIGTTTLPAVALEVWDKRAILIPVGTTADRPNIPLKGYIRYNTTFDHFEGYGSGSQWGSLGGVKDVNGDTYISAEASPNANDDILRFYNSNIERFQINKDGNVGIGTNAPTGLLHMYDRDTTRNTILLNWDSGSGARYANLKVPTNSFINPVTLDTNNSWEIQTNTVPRIKIDDTGIVSPNQIFLANGTAGDPGITFTNDTSTGIFLPQTHQLALTTSNTEHVRIIANGNVGIGTINPRTKLQVDGNAYIGQAIKSGAADAPTGGPFFKQSSWDSPGTTHTLTYPVYCEGDNTAGNLHIQVSNKKTDNTAKIGNVMVSFIKRYGDGVNLFIISHHKSSLLTTLNVTSSTNNIVVTTDNDCSISWTSIGSY